MVGVCGDCGGCSFSHANPSVAEAVKYEQGSGITAVAVWASEQRIFSGDAAGILKLWQGDGSGVMTEMKMEGRVGSILIVADFLFCGMQSGTYGVIKAWNLKSENPEELRLQVRT